MNPPELDGAVLDALPIFPLPNAVLFPFGKISLHVFEPRYRALTRDVLSSHRLMAVARLKAGFEPDYAGRPPVHAVCGVGRVVVHEELPDGRFDIVLRGISRIRIVDELPPERAYRLVRAELLEDAEGADPALLAAWQQKLGTSWERLSPHLPQQIRDLRELTREAPHASAFADIVAATVIANPEESQRFLEELDPAERLRLLVERIEQLSDALLVSRGRSHGDLN